MNYLRCLELIDELTVCIQGNEYEQFFVSHLLPIQVEIQRQLTNHLQSPKLKE